MMRRYFQPALSALLVTGLALAAATPSEARRTPLEDRDFELTKDEQIEIVVEVPATGLLKAQVHVRTPLATAPVTITFEGPDGIEIEKKGAAPLALRYLIEDNRRLGTWRVRIDNPGKMARLTGKIRIDFEARASPTPSAQPLSAEPSPTPIPEQTDGEILDAGDSTAVRAACRGRNEDVFVRLDTTTGEGGFFMNYRHVFPLRVRRLEGELFELSGGGDHPLLLDLENKTLSLGGENAPLFCRVRLFHDGS